MGELWQVKLWQVNEASPAPRVRKRTLRRWALPFFGVALVVAALATAVGRGEDGRRLSRELDRLDADELIVRDEVATQAARADSLASLPRMERAASRLGLRQAGDGEVFHLSDAASSAVSDEDSDIDAGRPEAGGDGEVRR